MDEPYTAGEFPSTHWSLVVSAGQRADDRAELALAELCQRYWYPIYAFIRRRGEPVENARDLAQEFFATLLEKGYLASADPQRGRFRAFLFTAVARFVSKQRDRERALKRGGGRAMLSLDFDDGERRYQLEPIEPTTPERIFERRWALTLLERTLDRLRAEHHADGKGAQFNELKQFLNGEGDSPLEQVSQRLGMTTGAVKVAIHRLRQKYRERLREEIACTVSSPDDIDDELRSLQAALRG